MNEKNFTLSQIKKRLDDEVAKRNQAQELSLDKPDPLLVAQKYPDEYAALICALFAYGNAKQIVKFLNRLDFSMLDGKEEAIDNTKLYYRFQTSEDIKALFIALNRLKRNHTLEDIFLNSYRASGDVMQGVFALIDAIRSSYSYDSKGYSFLIGKAHQKGTYKRWLMYLRWMVRKDHLDMGLWSRVDKKDLLMPLDTHTFKVSQKLGLLKRKSYDLKAVYEVTERLKKFDSLDPVKYDFALYRLGQEGML